LDNTLPMVASGEEVAQRQGCYPGLLEQRSEPCGAWNGGDSGPLVAGTAWSKRVARSGCSRPPRHRGWARMDWRQGSSASGQGRGA
jgi:hypothetical protein